MVIYDISVPIAPGETPVYEGDPGIEVGSWASISRGDPANVSVLNFGAHTGTHVDAPAHFIEGAPGMRSLPLDALLGEALVIAVPSGVRAIEESHVEELSHVGAARALVSRGVRLVGIDYLSVEEFGSKHFETHRTLLSNRVVILEGLDLRAVAPGRYELICLPLKITAGSGDGAPARAVLRTLD